MTALGDVTVSAAETGTIDATVGSVAFAVGVGGASVGVSLTQDSDPSTIKATMVNADVTGRAIQVTAGATDGVTADTLATSFAIVATDPRRLRKKSSLNLPGIQPSPLADYLRWSRA